MQARGREHTVVCIPLTVLLCATASPAASCSPLWSRLGLLLGSLEPGRTRAGPETGSVQDGRSLYGPIMDPLLGPLLEDSVTGGDGV